MPISLRFTSVALFLTVLYGSVVVCFGLDVFETVSSFLTQLEYWEIDEIVLPLLLLVLALCLDWLVWREKRIVSQEKEELLQDLETRCLDLAQELETEFARESDKQAVLHRHLVKLKSLSEDITPLRENDVKDVSSYM
ncbi:MAG: hypothetical protein AB7S81_00795 [Bdellovibrionales bacterium]